MQALVRLRRVFGLLDQLDHCIDVVNRFLQPDQDVLSILGDLEIVLAAPYDDLVAMVHEVPDHLFDVHDPRHTIDQRQHDRAERRLHLGVLVQPVQHDLCDGVSLQLHDDTHPVAVALVS